MSNYGILLLSKIIDNNDISALDRHNVTEAHFNTDAERKAYRFIRDYATTNRGQAPSYASVTEECPGFFYTPQVGESYGFLTRKLMNDSADAQFSEFVNNGELARLFESNRDDMPTFLDTLTERLEAIKLRTDVREKVGTDLKNDTAKFLSEYERRKAGESFRIWRSKFSAIGEYVSGNLYTIFGKSGRGKSVIALEDAIYAASQGANVLIWAMEMGWYEVLVRIYVSLSGESGITTAHLNGVDMSAGFDSRDVRLGQLNDEFEGAFRTFVGQLNEIIPGNITVRAVDDEDFGNRTLRALEADITMTKADYVVIDPFYFLDYEANTSKTAGGDAANTSMLLRRLAGRKSVVAIAITQAEETTPTEDDEGERELELPNRKDVKKTKSLLEDASLLIGVDSAYKQGRALVGVFKGRDGGEGNTSEILYMPQYGVVKEAETGANAITEFNF
ncbi:replicative DNA helicase [Psychrobacillus sp. OK032]|nr:DnaB-like helicase C-terminal domain-containing protein [Psychrobacillus sp. OK032]SER88396.1 replicative DNA helicase [Psychrobacillus sp. OK032]